jgi:hypothetical protein
MLEQKINNVIKTLDEIKRVIEQVPAARLVEIDGQFSENYKPKENYVHVDESIWFDTEDGTLIMCFLAYLDDELVSLELPLEKILPELLKVSDDTLFPDN